MRGILLLSFLGMASIGLAQDQTVINDENAQEVDITGFHGVEISGAIDLYFTQGDEEKVALSARNAEDIDKLIAEVRNGILYIGYKNGKSWWSNQWNTTGRRFRAYVSCPNVSSLSTSGSGNIYVQGSIKTSKLEVELSGSGNFDGNIQADELEVDQSGSSNVRLTGAADRATFTTSGSGNVIAPGFATNFCEIEISGSGNVEITGKKEISAEVSGSGNIRYHGEATLVKVSTSGSGKVRRVD